MFGKNMAVVVCECSSYEEKMVESALRNLFEKMNIVKSDIEGKRVAVKPNLVRKAHADKAITTHPSVLLAAVKLLKEYGAGEVVVVESPGGLFSEGILRNLYEECGIREAAQRGGATLNYRLSASYMGTDEAKLCRSFHFLDAFTEADVVVNLCKLKTHELTLMSGAVKNYFGLIPGIEKFEMHARYTTKEEFSEMLCDLCLTVSKNKKTINIMDAVIGMEGSGPTAGTPKPMGFVAASENAFELDLVAAHILGIDERVQYIRSAVERGLASSSFSDVKLIGYDDKFKVDSLALPDTEKVSSLRFSSRFLGGRTIKLFEPKPYITSKCIGCGVCERSCPMHTISMNKKKRKAVIDRSKCIRCYCCQELCPHTAIKIKKNFILRIIK